MQHNPNQTDLIKQKNEEVIQAQQEKEKNLKLVCANFFSTKNGKYFGKFLKEICKWDDTTCENIDVNPQVLAYQKGRRDIWLIVRNFIPAKDLANIEIFKD